MFDTYTCMLYCCMNCYFILQTSGICKHLPKSGLSRIESSTWQGSQIQHTVTLVCQSLVCYWVGLDITLQ